MIRCLIRARHCVILPKTTALRRVQRGFTLIELLAVVVILAVVATVAGTAVVDVQRDAGTAVVDAGAAAFADGLKLAKSAWYTRTDGSGPIVNMPGYGDGTVDFASHGYPVGSSVGVPDDNSALNPTTCAEVFNAVVTQARAVSASLYAAGAHDYNYRSTGSSNRCGFFPIKSNGALDATSGNFLYYPPQSGSPGAIYVRNPDGTVRITLPLP